MKSIKIKSVKHKKSMQTPQFFDSDNDRKKNYLDFYLKVMDILKKFNYSNGEYLHVNEKCLISLSPCVVDLSPLPIIYPINISSEDIDDLEEDDITPFVDGIDIIIESHLPKQIKSFRYEQFLAYDDDHKMYFNLDLIPLFEYTQEVYNKQIKLNKLFQESIQFYLELFIKP